jgi:hypothetical protein
MWTVRLVSSRGLLLRGLRGWVVLLLLWIWVLPGRAVADVELSEAQQNQLLAFRMFTEGMDTTGWDWEDWESLLELWERESNWRTRAANPRSTARGIPQAMMSLNPDIATNEWFSDPKAQVEWGMDYIGERYGSPSEALAHHDAEGWY